MILEETASYTCGLRTGIEHVAKRDHARMTQMELEVGALLVAGAPTEVKNDEGLTPLLQACRYDAGTIVRVLIAAEAEFRARSERAEAATVTPSRRRELPDRV